MRAWLVKRLVKRLELGDRCFSRTSQRVHSDTKRKDSGAAAVSVTHENAVKEQARNMFMALHMHAPALVMCGRHVRRTAVATTIVSAEHCNECIPIHKERVVAQLAENNS